MGQDRSSGRRSSEAVEIARELWERSWASIRRTPGLLFASLLIGTGLWIFVSDAENPTRVDLFPASVQVEAVNVGPSLAVASSLPAVQVRVSASDDRWEELSPTNLRAFVDLVGLDARAQEVRVRVDVEGISGVRVVETIPASVTVNLEDFVTRDIDVSARLVGAVPLGYEVVATSPEREVVRVSGPESLVALVREAVAEANVSGLTVPLTQTVDLTARGEAGGEILGVRIDPPSLGVAVDVVQTTLSRTLPVEVQVAGDPAPGYRVVGVTVRPSTVVVQGTIEVLQGLDHVTLSTVEISGVNTAEVRRVVPISLPAGVRSSADAQVVVTVTIAEVGGSVRLTIEPQAVNAAAGLEASFDRAGVSVLLEGPLADLGSLGAADVSVTVDAEGQGAGTVTLDVVVAAPEGISVASVQPQTLSVTLEGAQ
ncbi:MAG TPA: CdaR family protein [Dehalococcoidia bacterium]|nr:CdaR family protein [Dehalococcoidia bacterium]